MKRTGIIILLTSITLTASAQSEQVAAARDAYNHYRLTEASKLLSTTVGKGKRARAVAIDSPEADELRGRISTARNYLERVEKIQILDSIAVPKSEFFKAYKLPPSAGSLNMENDHLIFTDESGDYKAWSQPDSLGYMRVVESTRLTDGSWSEPHTLDDLSQDDSDADFPFMMADGVTMYYALDSEEGLGGYDIMVATREDDGTGFLQPQNMGMPYNSPFDDYMLAIDELNGVGWFATDRNQLGDDLTVYLFKVNDLRRNYDADTEGITDKALLVEWKSTQDPEADYTELLQAISEIDPSKADVKPDFHLPMDGGKVYTTYHDFRSSSAAAMMEKYMHSLEQFNKMEATMRELRIEYHNSRSEAARRQLRELEQQYNQQHDALKRELSEVYRAERQIK